MDGYGGRNNSIGHQLVSVDGRGIHQNKKMAVVAHVKLIWVLSRWSSVLGFLQP